MLMYVISFYWDNNTNNTTKLQNQFKECKIMSKKFPPNFIFWSYFYVFALGSLHVVLNLLYIGEKNIFSIFFILFHIFGKYFLVLLKFLARTHEKLPNAIVNLLVSPLKTAYTFKATMTLKYIQQNVFIPTLPTFCPGINECERCASPIFMSSK